MKLFTLLDWTKKNCNNFFLINTLHCQLVNNYWIKVDFDKKLEIFKNLIIQSEIKAMLYIS